VLFPDESDQPLKQEGGNIKFYVSYLLCMNKYEEVLISP